MRYLDVLCYAALCCRVLRFVAVLCRLCCAVIYAGTDLAHCRLPRLAVGPQTLPKAPVHLSPPIPGAPPVAAPPAGLTIAQLAALLAAREQACLTGFDKTLAGACASPVVAPCCDALRLDSPDCLGLIATTMADDPTYKHAALFSAL